MRLSGAFLCAFAAANLGSSEHEFNRPDLSKKEQDQLSCLQLASRSASAEADVVHAAQNQSDGQWVFCAAQNHECTCSGAVRWGNSGRWKVLPAPSEGAQTVRCSLDELGDLDPGRQPHCECFMTQKGMDWRSINPMLLTAEAADAAGAKVVASCEMFLKAQAEPWERAQRMAMRAFCSPDWDKLKGSDYKAGPEAMDLEKMRSLMEARLDPRFVDTYLQFADSEGWIARAFVNYFASSPHGAVANETIQLIRSIHLFSKNPVVAVNFGMAIPLGLDPQQFPRLVLLHARPLQSEGRSFNFNKFRGFLLSKVKTGVGLDSDQYVAPMVDNLFEMTEREIDEHYPLPIMPVHYLDWSPAWSKASFWSRVCPVKQPCTFQTMRWGHAHPTWTYHALPFFGRWLRKNFRDETLPEVEGVVPALRILEVREDEDLMNIGLWEERATKQWCKWDLQDPKEFEAFYKWQKGPQVESKNVRPDQRFYKRGAVKLFYSAHHAVHPSESEQHITRMHD
ncbi:unnamed protein product, partial [Symbiodinium pilosum]